MTAATWGGDVSAYGDAVVARAYDVGRPGYPDAVIDQIVEGLQLSATSRVLDVAAGTGKLTERLVPRVGSVVAVDLVPAMLEVLSRRVPSATVLQGAAESLPCESDSFDAVTVADAFHWFEIESALAEAARVLRPGKGMAIVKHAPLASRAPPSWLRCYRALLERVQLHDPDVGPDLPLEDPQSWHSQLLSSDRYFTVEYDGTFDQRLVQSRDAFVQHALSRAFIGGYAEPRRSEILDEITELLSRHQVAEIVSDYTVTVVLLRMRRASPLVADDDGKRGEEPLASRNDDAAHPPRSEP
jgi:SAM-dependent methyltransferase